MNRLRKIIMAKWPTCRAFARFMSEKYGAGWDEGMISRLACGVCWPTSDRLELLCRELKCTAGDIYDADELRRMAETGLAGLTNIAERGKEWEKRS